MSKWKAYVSRTGVENNKSSNIKRETRLAHMQEQMCRKAGSSLSYDEVIINGLSQQISIIDVSDDYNVKKIFSLPNESVEHGGLVVWNNSYWLITEVNPRKEAYSEGKMTQCNHVLKWIDDEGNIIEKWCIVVDGTKYLIGEKSEDMMSIGDARIAVTLGRDKDTIKLHRGKRFLIDDEESDEILAYQITKPNRFFNTYGGKGVYRFILNEVNLTDEDNLELGIADYYNWRPKKDRPESDVKSDCSFEDIINNETNKTDKVKDTGVWL